MVPTFRGVLASLGLFDLLKTRRRAALGPALERRQPEIAAENYAARHLLEHTLDRKADLRRMAPDSLQAARRYRELLGYELNALEELGRTMSHTLGGGEVAELLGETAAEIERLRIEIAWCDGLIDRLDTPPAGH